MKGCRGLLSHGPTCGLITAERDGYISLDVGANIGCHTVPFAKLVGESGRVVAFEPQRLVFQNLCANLALNALTNVYVYHWQKAMARS